MSNYILIHSQLNYERVPSEDGRGRRTYENQRGENEYILKFLDNLDDFYHYVIDIMSEGETEEEPFDIYDYWDETIGGYGLDQEFILFKDGQEKPIFQMTNEGNTTLGDFENFCFGKPKSSKKPITEMKRFKSFNESKKEKFPNIKRYEIDGFIVTLGRDAKSNDHLTFIMSGDKDYWMHVKGVPGSHVVIKVKDKLPTETIIKQAAEIAKKNSKADQTKSATVVYCQRQFVKKGKDMNPGQVKVDYKNAYEIEI